VSASAPDDNPPEPPRLEVRTYFVRHRNALLARGDFSDLIVDYYLHLADQGLKPDPALDTEIKDCLVGLALYAAGRPWAERIAWTLHYENPLHNLFVTADNTAGTITGTFFIEDVRRKETNLFYNDVLSPKKPLQRSMIGIGDAKPLAAVEMLFHQSEQRKARFFRFRDDDWVLLSAQPDCDEDWLAGLTADDIRCLDRNEELSLLERRPFRWFCGCSQERMVQIVLPVWKSDAAGLFGEEDAIRMRCPRCGARHVVTREAVEALEQG